MSSLGDWFNDVAKEHPGKPALVTEDKSWTYRELQDTVNAVVSFLDSKGIKKGDRVAQFCPTSVELISFFLANLKLGCVVVPINIHFKRSELDHILDDAEVKVIFVDDERLPLVQNIRDAVIHQSEISGLQPGSPQRANVTDADGAIIFYTSGTTGKPKGALLSHKNIIANLSSLYECWGWHSDDMLLHALPMYHIHGLGVALLGSLMCGNTIYLRKKFNALDALDAMTKEPITLFMGTPTHYELLMREKIADYNLSGMRLFISGSAPLSAEQFERFKSITHHEIVERAGMSETMMNCSNPVNGKRKPGTVGPPLPGVSVRIVDEKGNDVAEGNEGQLLLRGENVFSGYINKDNAPYFRDGYFLTGDIAKRDNDGYITLMGRMHDVIISGGINIYPKEIEDVIAQLKQVSDCAVVGVPDKLFGEAPHAFVVAESITKEQIISHCKDRLASFKKPKYVTFVDQLPRNSMGKVQKNELRQLAMSSSSISSAP